jgi:hypothetical protein
VLLSPAVQAGSFPLDGKAKLAFERGLIQAPPGFPDELLRAMRHHHPQAGPPADPLQVATATQSVSGFLTDRGKQQLPAWEVHARGVPEPIWVLDPSVTLLSWWLPEFEHDELRWPGSRAKLAGDQRTITLRFSGMPCTYADYPHIEVLADGNAVALLPLPEDAGSSGPRRAYAETREVSVTLPQALGARMLLDGNGSPVLVCL